MKCSQARRLLTRSPGREGTGLEGTGLEGTGREARAHLRDCEACAGFAERLTDMRMALGDHHAEVTAPPGFARRIVGRLPSDEDSLGWAALRLLPATLILVLLLSWLNIRDPATVTEASDPTEAVLGWVLDPVLAPGGAETGDGS